MTVNYTTLLGLAKPVSGTESGTWGDTVNTNLTDYLDSAVAGAQIISGTQTAVTLSKTTGASLSQAGLSNTTGSSQYQIIRCTGSPSSLLTITAPAADKTYIIINATSTSQSVKIVGAGPTTGITILSGKTSIVAWNGTDFVEVSPGTVTSVAATVPSFLSVSGSPITSSGTLAVTLSGTALPVANGGTGVTTSTGSVNVVLSNSPTLVTPVLGTPSSGTLSSCTVDGTNGVGYINIPQNSQSAAYTLVAADAGKQIFHPSSDTTARTFTIPANSSVAYPIGTELTIINQYGAGVVTLTSADTLRLVTTGTTGNALVATGNMAQLIKVTSTEWLVSGATYVAPPPTVIGQAYGGGFYAGKINVSGTQYYLIVAPKATGEASRTWGTYGVTTGITSVIDGPANSASLAALGAAYQAAVFAEGLTIGGYSDWYLPAKNELEVLYYFLKPDTTANSTSSGSNANAVSPEPISQVYTSGSPAQTSAGIEFRTGETEAFASDLYWSSTEFNSVFAWRQYFLDGGQGYFVKSNSHYVRAVRRIAV